MRLNPIRIDDDDLENNMENECPSCGNDPWPKPSLAVDAVVTRKNGDEILLIRNLFRNDSILEDYQIQI